VIAVFGLLLSMMTVSFAPPSSFVRDPHSTATQQAWSDAQQTISLFIDPYTGSVDGFVAQRLHARINTQIHVEALARRSLSLCGGDARLLETRYHDERGRELRALSLFTVAGARGYIANYTRPATAVERPDARASLLGLCVRAGR